MNNCKIKTSFVGPEGPKARANKTGIHFMTFILIFVKIIRFYTWFFSMAKNGSNPTDNNVLIVGVREEAFTR